MASRCISIKRWAAARTKDLLRLNGLIGSDRSIARETRLAVLQAFDDLWSDIHQGASREAITWLRHSNSAANIHKLPLEIILIIFNILLLTSKGSRRHQYVTKLVTLRSVSWMWREIIDQNPFFWNHLHSNDHINFVSSALQKSRRCGLHLEDLGLLQSRSSQVDFLTEVSHHAERWEQLVLQERGACFIENYFRVIAALVHFRKLRTLDLENCYCLPRESFFSVLSENSDTLTVLRLCTISFGGFTRPQQDYQQISLNVLSEIVLDGSTRWSREDMSQAETSPLTWLLKQVKIPACTRFVFKIHVWNATVAQFDGLLLFLPRPIDISLRNLQRYGAHAKPPTARITFSADTFSCEVYGCSSLVPQYSIMLIGASCQASVEWTRNELAGEWLGDVELRYCTEQDLWPMTRMLELKHLSTVTRLEVQGHATKERATTESLATILGSPGGSGEFLFTRLSSLSLSHRGVTSGEVLELVRARFGSPPSQKQRHNEKPIRDTKIDGPCFTIILGGQMDRWTLPTIKEFEEMPGVRVIPWRYHLGSDQEDDESGLSD